MDKDIAKEKVDFFIRLLLYLDQAQKGLFHIYDSIHLGFFDVCNFNRDTLKAFSKCLNLLINVLNRYYMIFKNNYGKTIPRAEVTLGL